MDSQIASAAQALAVLSAAQWAREMSDFQELVQRLRQSLNRYQTYFVVDTLEFMQKGGRIGKASAFLGGMLKVKPILTVRDGEVHPVERPRSRERARSRLIELIRSLAPVRQLNVIYSTDRTQALAVRAELSDMVEPEHLVESPVRPGARHVSGSQRPRRGGNAGQSRWAVTPVTGQKANTAEFAEALSKILAEESRRGYDNRTVIGGLDKFRERWQAEMAACVGQSSGAAFLLRQSYAGMPPEQREAWAGQWKRLVEGESVTRDQSPAPQPPEPSPRPVRQPNNSVGLESAASPPSARRESRTLPKPRPAYGAPPTGQSVDDPVDRLKGVDAKTAARLERLDVATVRDLLYLFPRRHDDYSQRGQRVRSYAGPGMHDCRHRLGVAGVGAGSER